MNIDKQKVYTLYMQWVKQVAEECDWKTSFSPAEIVGAICVILEENPNLIEYGKPILTVNNVTHNPNTCIAEFKGRKVKLTNKLSQILYALMSHPDRLISKDELLKTLWGEDVIVLSQTIDVHVSKLRKMLFPEVITCVKRVGYMFNS